MAVHSQHWLTAICRKRFPGQDPEGLCLDQMILTRLPEAHACAQVKFSGKEVTGRMVTINISATKKGSQTLEQSGNRKKCAETQHMGHMEGEPSRQHLPSLRWIIKTEPEGWRPGDPRHGVGMLPLWKSHWHTHPKICGAQSKSTNKGPCIRCLNI